MYKSMAHAMHVRILNMEGHIAEKGMLESLRILYIHDLLLFFLFFFLFFLLLLFCLFKVCNFLLLSFTFLPYQDLYLFYTYHDPT